MDGDLRTLPEEFETLLIPSWQTAPFRLLALPTELWLHILAFAVTTPQPIEPSRARDTKHQQRIVAQPAITRTCHLLRTEGLSLFYGSNRFECVQRWATACTRDWLVAIGEANRKTMGRFVFHAAFETEFWIRQFGKCGIQARVKSLQMPEDGDGEGDREGDGPNEPWLQRAMERTTELNESDLNGGFETLVVTFL